MNIDYDKLFALELSDACVYQLMKFFANMHFIFEDMFYAQGKSCGVEMKRANESCEEFLDDNQKEEDDECPF